MTNLTEIIKKNEDHPKEVEVLCNEAFSSFNPPEEIADYPDLQDTVAAFHCALRNKYLNINMEVHHNHDWGQVLNVICNVYGPNGDRKACYMAVTGENGGLRQVLRDICSGLVKQWGDQGISNIVSDYLTSLGTDEHIATAKEYLDKFGYLLPNEYTKGDGIRAIANFHKVLETHPWIIDRTRNIRG